MLNRLLTPTERLTRHHKYEITENKSGWSWCDVIICAICKRGLACNIIILSRNTLTTGSSTFAHKSIKPLTFELEGNGTNQHLKPFRNQTSTDNNSSQTEKQWQIVYHVMQLYRTIDYRCVAYLGDIFVEEAATIFLKLSCVKLKCSIIIIMYI